MITIKEYNEFINRYKKKICYRTYRRYKNSGYTDLKIATTDLRNGGHFVYKDTIKNRMRKFNEVYGFNVSYSYYYGRIKSNISEKEMLSECKKGVTVGNKKGVKRGKYNTEDIKEEVRESKFKPLPRVDLNIEAGEDPYYSGLNKKSLLY